MASIGHTKSEWALALAAGLLATYVATYCAQSIVMPSVAEKSEHSNNNSSGAGLVKLSKTHVPNASPIFEQDLQEPETVNLHSVSSVKTTAEEFHDAMTHKVRMDNYGNYWVELAALGNSRRFLLSRWPFYYPSPTELNSSAQACTSGGYLIEFGAEVVFLEIQPKRTHVFTNRCQFDSAQQGLALVTTDNVSELQNSIAELLAVISQEPGANQR